MKLYEEFVSRQEIFHGRIVDLRVDTVRLPNGHLTTREVIDHPGGVAVVAIDGNDNVLTVKQYRYAFQTVLEEIPAGKLERGEDPAAAARRELSEETGASCETLTPLGEILASPGGFTEVLHLYMATGLTFGSQHPDEDEFINFERIPFDPEKSELTGYSNYSYWQSTFRTFFKKRSSVLLLTIMCAFVLMSLLYPMICEMIPGWETSYRNPNFAETGSATWNLAPCAEHLFGTDNIGRDMWSRTWYGTRTSLLLGFVIAFFDVTLGTIAGALWGYVRRIDRFMTELYNIVTNIPQTVYLVLFTYILRPSFWTIVLAMCLTGWLSIARFVRNRVVAIRENEYNIASQCLGTPLFRILIKNIVPYIVSIIIMEVALTIPYSIGSEVFLSYINLGLPLDVVSLGNLVSVGKNSFEVYPFQLIYPTIILSFVTVSFYIVGNRFADASDPRNHI